MRIFREIAGSLAVVAIALSLAACSAGHQTSLTPTSVGQSHAVHTSGEAQSNDQDKNQNCGRAQDKKSQKNCAQPTQPLALTPNSVSCAQSTQTCTPNTVSISGGTPPYTFPFQSPCPTSGEASDCSTGGTTADCIAFLGGDPTMPQLFVNGMIVNNQLSLTVPAFLYAGGAPGTGSCTWTVNDSSSTPQSATLTVNLVLL